ncbi:hypothetical protein Trydic_g13385, partial [Trypoxylus dichotomus]
LAPGNALKDASGRHLQGNAQTCPFVSPPEGIQGQARRAAVHSQECYSSSVVRVSDLTLLVQHLHQRHFSNHICQLGDVRGQRLYLRKIPGHPDNRLLSQNSSRHFAGLVCKVENRRPSSEKHDRGFLEKRAPKKRARQPSQTHFPRRHHPLVTSDQVPKGHIRFPRQMSGTLYPLLLRRYKLDPTRKTWTYNTVLSPIVTYASAISETAATTHMNKLQTFQKRILRMALNAPWFVRNTILHEDAGEEPLIDFIRRIATLFSFIDRPVDHCNPLVSASQDYDLRIPWRYPRPRLLVVGDQNWQQSTQPANHHPEMEPSHFVEEADSLEPKYDKESVPIRGSRRIGLAYRGCLSTAGPGELIPINTRMNAAEYICILEDVVVPRVRLLYPPPAPGGRQLGGLYLNTNSLNPIESLWGCISTMWKQDGVLVSRNRHSLYVYVMRISESIRDRPNCENLVASMHNMFQEVAINFVDEVGRIFYMCRVSNMGLETVCQFREAIQPRWKSFGLDEAGLFVYGDLSIHRHYETQHQHQAKRAQAQLSSRPN